MKKGGGVSIRTSRTSRRFMNIHYGKHGIEMSLNAVLSIHECHEGDLDIFHHFERTDPRWWCVDSYESSIHEYS